MITGSEGTDQLFQLKVDLSTGEAHQDTLPQDGIFHFNDEDAAENRMSLEERSSLLTQFNMDRSTMPSHLEWVLFQRFAGQVPPVGFINWSFFQLKNSDGYRWLFYWPVWHKFWNQSNRCFQPHQDIFQTLFSASQIQSDKIAYQDLDSKDQNHDKQQRVS